MPLHGNPRAARQAVLHLAPAEVRPPCSGRDTTERLPDAHIVQQHDVGHGFTADFMVGQPRQVVPVPRQPPGPARRVRR